MENEGHTLPTNPNIVMNISPFYIDETIGIVNPRSRFIGEKIY